MIKNLEYYMPTKIVYGCDSLNEINQYVENRKTLVITSNSFKENGGLERIKTLIPNIVAVIFDVKSHPQFCDLEVIYNKIKKIDYELIVAVGGGSVLDAAKFCSVYNDNKDYQFVEDITKGKIDKKNYSLMPIIAIPTTAGTGSEVTPWATVWDMEEKKKYSLHLPNLFPSIAIYDPCLTLTVPLDITIQTGLDTLSHALESIWNKNANEITLSYAIKSAKLIFNNLTLLCNDLENLTHRTAIMKGCMYAGLSFSNTQTAMAHAMSYFITAHKNIPHGIACSFTLPLLIDNIIGRFNFIDEALIAIFGSLSSSPLRGTLKTLNVSSNFEDYGINNLEKTNLISSLNTSQRAGNSLVKL